MGFMIRFKYKVKILTACYNPNFFSFLINIFFVTIKNIDFKIVIY